MTDSAVKALPEKERRNEGSYIYVGWQQRQREIQARDPESDRETGLYRVNVGGGVVGTRNPRERK